MDSVGQEQGQNRCMPADFVCVPVEVLHIYIMYVFTSVSVIKYLLNSGRSITCLKENCYSCF